MRCLSHQDNGRPIRSLAFVGADLYLATADGLAVIRNVLAATFQDGSNGVPVADGFSGVENVELSTGGINRLYLAINAAGSMATPSLAEKRSWFRGAVPTRTPALH